MADFCYARSHHAQMRPPATRSGLFVEMTARKTPAKRTRGKAGRPSAYRKDMDDQVFAMAAKGWTDVEMAKLFKVSRQTFDAWKKKHPTFLASIEDGKNEFDNRIERSLAERALGASHPEQKVFLHGGEPVIVDTTKHYPPDTSAAFIWLRNRRPDKWRDRQEHDHRVAAVVVPVSSTSGIIREIAGGSAGGSLPEPVSE